jgi:hypothetical protein
VPKWIEGAINVNVLLSFVFGVVFIVTMLAFAVFDPYPSGFSEWIFITVLALAAAGVGSVIPGMLNVDLPYVKAGGAIALFAVVFLLKPAIESALPLIQPPLDSPDSAIVAYFNKVDAKQIDAAWDQLDPEAKKGVARDRNAYRQAYASGRDPLGIVKDRSLMGIQELQSPSGFPQGVYRVIAYRTKFASGECHVEQAMVRGSNDRIWRVYEHNISPATIPC